MATTTMPGASQTSADFQHNGYPGEAQHGSGLRSATSSVAREFRDLIGDIEDFITSTTSLSGEELERAKQRLRARVDNARDTLQEMGESVAERARRTASATNDYVYEKPWTAVGVSAAAGLLIGFLLSRR